MTAILACDWLGIIWAITIITLATLNLYAEIKVGGE